MASCAWHDAAAPGAGAATSDAGDGLQPANAAWEPPSTMTDTTAVVVAAAPTIAPAVRRDGIRPVRGW